MEKKRNLSALTGLRFFAAFYVFVFHIYLRQNDPIPIKTLDLFVRNGAIGVNIFFILSGLILFYNYYDRKIIWSEFILKRLAKIYPVYLLGLVLSIGVVYIAQHPIEDFKEIILLNLTLIQSYFPSKAMEWYGGGAWSISTEFFFYFLSPFIIHIVKNLQKRTLWILLGLTFGASLVAGVLYHFGKINFNLGYSFPVARLPEFIVGNILASLIFVKNIKVNNIILWGILLLSFVSFYLLGNKVRGYTILNFFIIPTTCVILYFLINYPKNLISNIIGGGIIEYLGKISYSFYIIQIPITLYLDYSQFLKDKNILVYGVIIFIINIFVAALAYHWVEIPTHKLLNKKIKKLFNK